MKIIYSAIILFIATLSYSQVFTENFENGGSIPTGWTQFQESYTVNWAFQAGGSSGHPAAAHGGSYNALFKISTHTNDGAKTKLISPTLSLTGGNDYYLTFYYANEIWNTDQDILRVYYKSSGIWHLIETYNVNQASWKKRIVPIPSNATNIAFEGESYFGYGVCVDDVRIDQVTRISTVNTCDYLYTDNGGSSANYTDNQSTIQTFTSNNNSCIRAVIDYYELESGFDYLYVYDGTDLTGELLQVFTGSSINTNVSSTLDDNGTAFYGLSGSLTFYFYSDISTNNLGWKINLDCPENCVAPPCSGNTMASDDCSLPTPICNLNGYCGNTGSSYTADHTELNYNQSGIFCGTIENNSWLTFVADSTTALIDVWVYNCTGIAPLGRVHGIQIEIFSGNCNGFTAVSNCWSPNKEANGRIKATGLTPGQTYYIMIDGWGADDCQYSFAASTNSGIIVANAGLDKTICEGQTVSLNASGGNTIYWDSSPSDASLSGQETNASINVNPSQTTIYTATVNGSNPNCPGSTADVVVYVNQANASFTGLDAQYCQENITSALSGNYTTGVFSGAGISGTNFNTNNAGIGYHDITYSYNYSVVTVFDDDFDPTPNAGWTHGAISGSDSWATGEPKGGDGDNTNIYWLPDPVLDHTSTNTNNKVYGQGLSDLIGDGLGGYYDSSNEWLKSPSINCSSISNSTLSFWQYANFENVYDEAYVEISTDGTNWNSLAQPLYPMNWEWEFTTINISAYADGHSTVYIRWRSNSDVSQTYSGWNIDDVKVTGVQNGGTCVSTDVQTTQVFEPVNVSVSQTTANICANQTYNAVGTITGGSTTGNWTSSGSGTFSNASSLNTTYTPSATDISNGNVTLTLTSTNPTGPCNSDNAQINITINPLDDAYFEYVSNTFCNTGTNVFPTNTPNSTGSYSVSPTGLSLNSTTGEINISGSTINTYTVTYTTNGTCPATYSTQISVVSGFDAEFSYSNSEFCQSGTNPIPTHTTGTNGVYTSTPALIWGTNVGEIDLSASNPGVYTITNTIVASGSCPAASATQQITISEAPIVSISQANSICSNENIYLEATISGSATSVNWTSSGNGTFSNSSNLTTYYYPSATDIASGLVSFTATTNNPNNICDAASTNVNVNIFEQPQISISLQNPHCNLTDGNISSTPIGGTSPYYYNWSNGSTSQNLTNISSGTYSLTITDANNCINDTTLNISDLNAGTVNIVSLVNPTCFGYSNGNISINMTGGTPNFTYQWTNGETTSLNENLISGIYIVTVTDAYNCVVTEEFTLTQPSELISVNNIYDIKCNGETDGNITVNVSGGTPSYNYSWEHTSNNTNILNNIGAGTYYLNILDSNLCSLKDTFILTEPSALNIDYATIDVTCKERQNGEIALSINGGVSPYNLLWSNNLTDSILHNLQANTYSVTITDLNNCTKTESIVINGSTESCLKIPSVFTPNNDGVNDYWEIQGCDFFETISIKIFNRWGDVVFSFDGKSIDYSDKNNQWDGSFKNSGKAIDLSSFVYVIYLNGEQENYNGTVTIVE